MTIEQKDKVFVIYNPTGGTATTRPYLRHKTGRYDPLAEEVDDRPTSPEDYDAATEAWVVMDDFPESADADRAAFTTVPQEPIWTVDPAVPSVSVSLANASLSVRQRETRRILERRRKRLIRLLGLESKISVASFALIRAAINKIDDVDTDPNWSNPEAILSDSNYNIPAVSLDSSPLVERVPGLFGSGTMSRLVMKDGIGKNLIRNSDFLQGAGAWDLFSTGTLAGQVTVGLRENTTFTGANYPVLAISQNNAIATGSESADYANARINRLLPNGTLDVKSIPVTPGRWYEWTPQLSIHRCNYRLIVDWYDATGTFLSNSSSATQTDQNSGSSSNPDEWQRNFYKFQAPAGAAFARPYIRKYGTLSGTTSFVFVHKPFFAETHADATVPAPYNDGPSGLITGSGLLLGSILREHLLPGSFKYDDCTDISYTAAAISSQTSTASAATGLASITIQGGVSTDLVFIEAFTNIQASAGGDQVRMNAWLTVQIGAGAENVVGNGYVEDWGFTGGGRKQIVLMGVVTANTVANLTFNFRLAKNSTHVGGNPSRIGGLLRARRVSG